MPGDQGTPPNGKYMFDRWFHFAPRVGLAWDPSGDGMMVLRAAYGLFNELPPAWTFYGNGAGVPWNSITAITNPNFADPWNLPSGSFPNGYPGGNPLPSVFTSSSSFPLSGDYDNIRMHAKSTYVQVDLRDILHMPLEFLRFQAPAQPKLCRLLVPVDVAVRRFVRSDAVKIREIRSISE